MILHRRLAWSRIANAAARRGAQLVAAWLPDARPDGDGWRAPSPRTAGATELRIGPAGDFVDHAAHVRGRDLIGLAAHLHQLARPEAALLVARLTGTHPYD